MNKRLIKNHRSSFLIGLCSIIIGVLLAPLYVFASGQACETEIHVACGKTPSATFVNDDKHGSLTMLVVFAQNDHIYFTQSNDLGLSYTTPIAINSTPEKIHANGENRPKITSGTQNEIYVSWTKKTQGRYTGDIRFSRSLDRGQSFSTPVVINNDRLLTGHRFDTMHVAPSGKLYISWLDKRDQVAARKSGEAYNGSALYFAVSDDSGESFLTPNTLKNYRIANNSCECCRIAMTASGQDNVAVLWRHIFDKNTRDHAYAILRADGTSTIGRATVDNWNINACPHHGPDLAVSKSKTETGKDQYHMVWFSNGIDHKGIYYGLHNFTDNNSSQVYSVDSRSGASHPQIVSVILVEKHHKKETLYIAWKYFDGEKTHISVIASEDKGSSWSESSSRMTTTGNSDHPMLYTHNTKVFLAWHTDKEGYRVSPIN